MANDYRPIETAPKDGTVVLLRADNEGPFLMYWDAALVNPLVGPEPGVWVLEGGGLTWCDRDPAVGPTHWAPRR